MLNSRKIVLLCAALCAFPAAYADSEQDKALAVCEKEAIDNDAEGADRVDYIRGCMAELGYSLSTDSGDVVEEQNKPGDGEERG